MSTGLQDYQLHFDDVIAPLPTGGTDIRGGFKVADTITFIGAGLNVACRRFFADASGQWSQNGKDHNQQIEGNASGDGIITSGDGQNHNSDVSSRRRELHLSVGWAATSNFSVYGRYKYAKVDLTQHLSPIMSPPPLVNYATGQDGNVLFFADHQMNFTYKGEFVGATCVVPVGSLGAISLQSSLARLDGVFRQHFTGDVFVTNPNFSNNLRPIDPAFKDGQEKNTRARFELRYRFGGASG